MKKIILVFIIFVSIISFSNSESKKFTSDNKLHIEELMAKDWKYGGEGLPVLNLKITEENKKYYGIITTENGKILSKQRLKVFKKFLLQDEVGYCYGYDIKLNKMAVVNPEDMTMIFVSYD